MVSEAIRVPAAPNRCEIEAEILAVNQSEAFPDRWELKLKILKSRSIAGPNFAHPGETANALAFGNEPGLSPGTVITAEAEFVGDERGGRFRLSRVASA